MTSEQLTMQPDGSPKRKQKGRREATSEKVTEDPLTQAQARSLLTSVSVIRDPLHGDIRFTELERIIINSLVFQRLRRINQLAMVDLVYPGAVHTRFLHSLGVLHVCSELIESCNNSAKMLQPLAPPTHPVPVRIGFYAELLTRLVALLHDTAHVPFGHVFEREAQVFEKDEWEDPWRVQQVFDSESELMVEIKRYFVRHFSSIATPELRLEQETAEHAAESLLLDVKAVLSAKGTAIRELRYPFVYDLVSNTICADLIDYVQRDMYFAGLSEGLAKRFLQYIAVLPVEYLNDLDGAETLTMQPSRQSDGSDYAEPRQRNGSRVRVCRVVLLTYRYNARRVATEKQNLLTEAIDLVRRRKIVAEKLYFHKTKLMATSMLAAAAHAVGITSAKEIWDKSDQEVLKWMAREENGVAPGDAYPTALNDIRRTRARRLSRNILDRRLFKPIYQVSFHPDIEDAIGIQLWHPETGVYARYSNPTGREELIQEIEQILASNLSEPAQAIGSVSISCPNRRMQLKAFEMLVLSHPVMTEVKPLQQTVKPTVHEEITVIQKGHQELWRLEVFVDPSILDFNSELARKLAGAIQHTIGPRNEVGDFQDATPLPISQLRREVTVKRELSQLGLLEEIRAIHYQQLVEGDIAAREGFDLAQQLRAWKYKFP